VLLVRLFMEAQRLQRMELNMSVARIAMSPLQHDLQKPHLNGKQIAEVVAAYYHLSFESLCGKQRDKHIVLPRQVAMYLIRQDTQVSLYEIGQLFGGRDHTTVLHSWQKIDRALQTNHALQHDITAIREQLRQRENR
jgi:chromosomal replication initiator protein